MNDKERMRQILEELGIEMDIAGCRCCESPRVTFKYKGETIVNDEGYFSFCNIKKEYEETMLKPMRGVAPKSDLTDFPYLVTPKIDGMRALVKDGVVYSKTMKPIPNKQVQAKFGHLHGADGELTVGPPYTISPEDDVFDRSRGPIMRKDCVSDFQFHVFDVWDAPELPALRRAEYVWDRFYASRVASIVSHFPVHSAFEVQAALEQSLESGYEGVMLRQAYAPYKYGQSTEKEGYLLKLKPFEDAEAIILDVIEQQTNTNEATKDELGYAKRSSAKSGRVANGTFGAFLVRDLRTGAEFSVGNGPGLTAVLRNELWSNRDALVGKIITYKYQEIGTKKAPRLPQFLRFRDPIDLTID